MFYILVMLASTIHNMVIPAAMFYILVMFSSTIYNMVILAGTIYNLNIPCLHILNYDAMIYLTIYDYIFIMINYLYVIIFMCIFF